MSGSLSYQVYTTDAGTNYAVLCDKSNALAVNTTAQATPGSLPADTIPRNIKPRYAIYTSADGLVRRRVIILTPADIAGVVPGQSFTPQGESAVVRLSFYSGEKRRLPKTADTGKTT